GDVIVQAELVTVKYAEALIISFCSSGGSGEQIDNQIINGLNFIVNFIKELHKGRNNHQQYFQPQPALARICYEQIEEEAGNEEIDILLNNKGQQYNKIKIQAKKAKKEIFNLYINQSNTQPDQYL
ncbi:MAG: hypothetical protein EZS28_027840, partial [Streblomastix strix]